MSIDVMYDDVPDKLKQTLNPLYVGCYEKENNSSFPSFHNSVLFIVV